MNVRILVVDDEETIRKLLHARFTREGWTCEVAEDGRHALELVANQTPDVVFTDIKMPGLDGFQLIDAFRAQGMQSPVVVITGHGEKEAAIEAVRRGAFDYLEKPFDMEEIAMVARRAVEREQLRRQNVKLVADLEAANAKLAVDLEVKGELLELAESTFPKEVEDILIGKSAHVTSVKQMARTVAESFRGDNDPVVLVTGESGVGKEMVARYMHAVCFGQDYKAKPFVGINCAAFPDNLLESELFGYEKGAFTGAVTRKVGLFEVANNGTLFLDEIGEMDLKMQAKLLRVLQERVIRRLGGTADITVRPHIIAATNKDLQKAVAAGTFREDLFYRLNTLPILVAPLRNRTEDVELLARYFLKTLAAGRSKKYTGFSPAAMRALMAYRWPGNVRELRSVIERAVILEKGPMLELSHLRQEHLHAEQMAKGVERLSDIGGETPTDDGTGSSTDTAGVVLKFPGFGEKSLSDLRKEMDERLVRQILTDTLAREHGNVSSVARILKLDRANLLRMLKRSKIDPELFRPKLAG